MTSADFSQFVVTARLLHLKPRLRDLPSYGRTLSGLYPLGLLSAVRIVIGLLLPLQHYPCLPAFYQVLVHRANRLPPASFRFHLTMDTLAFGCNLPTIRAVWGLAPVRVRSCWANIKKTRPSCDDRVFEERQLPTLPPGGAVPSAMAGLTSLFGMGRGGSPPL